MISILELLHHIVSGPVPKSKPEVRFLKATEKFVDVCLLRDSEAMKMPKELLVSISNLAFHFSVALINLIP